ncbi:Rho GTPase activating protein, putative [Entamoeba histolytica HM-1:IMSS-B]|uniref:Rho GTPase activating protein, putative n=5 Tax=Entamoeba histolytica TaxID=5759 RepID=C4M5E9_ENTH1|nr:Rho GTPase activating protein, putative [Entamoeba histolytica HM-1:IMSS]EMD42987.1 rho GTPase-activating protein, putative [Entamoeba histolytica KU27]EMH78052.1 Rho GTPase activating protein, putative [Entamoeba histolytica HM-1:IMSS-B]ENY59790.1 Rho GTPase-activating protein, putative [Entamoeba histolytica HM-1:IMSS-A]GAT96642.1 Rho GTPase activating protein putative [Entamoeba histolytica]EAL47224.1 Rho GTPase activating protein, putative [Entamoeba histolytica HM-1:IMSS]|eukprot:XP_652610.1 Rho GTPase activating protein, putative [Entamoeba histolytica HM-1:IMSS]
MSEYIGAIEIRGGTFKKFTKVQMECKNDYLKIYHQGDRSKEKISISMSVAIFHKKLTWLKKFPKEQEELAFEIAYDKLYQFICPNYIEYSTWLNIIPLKMRCNEVFGVPLSVGVKKSGWRFPLPIYRCLEYLEKNDGLKTEGIFRLSSSIDETKRIKEIFDGGQDVTMQIIGDVHVAAGLIKLYLRELPDSLIPKSMYNTFLELPTSSDLNNDIKKQIQTFPDINKNTLWLIMRFLSKVIQNTSVNQMTSTNLCVCFSPSLFRSPDNDMTREMTDTPKLRTIIDSMITHFTDIFYDIEKENHKLGIIPPTYPAIIPISSISSEMISDAVNKRNKSLVSKIEKTNTSLNSNTSETPITSKPLQPVMQSVYDSQHQKYQSTSQQQDQSIPNTTFLPSKSRNAFLQHLNQSTTSGPRSSQFGTSSPNGFLSRQYSHNTTNQSSGSTINIGTRNSPTSPIRNVETPDEVQQIPLIPHSEQLTPSPPCTKSPEQQQKAKFNAFAGARITTRCASQYHVHDTSLQALILPPINDNMNDAQKVQSLQRRVDALISKAIEQDKIIYEFRQKLIALGVTEEEIEMLSIQKSPSPTNQPRRSVLFRPTDKSAARGTFLGRGRTQQTQTQTPTQPQQEPSVEEEY